MGLLIPTLKWTGLNSSLMISLCVSLSCLLSFLSQAHTYTHTHTQTHTYYSLHNWKNRTFKSDLLVRRFAHKWVKSCKKQICLHKQKTIKVVTKAGGSRLHYVSFCGFHCLSSASSSSESHHESLVEQRRQVQVETEEMWGFFEGREQVAQWSRRGRNSAVGCISVSRSDGWVVALFVLCCHTALAPAWALMRGGRTAGQEHGGPPTQVICHEAVLLGQGDTWRQRGEERQRGWPRSTWAPTCGTF